MAAGIKWPVAAALRPVHVPAPLTGRQVHDQVQVLSRPGIQVRPVIRVRKVVVEDFDLYRYTIKLERHILCKYPQWVRDQRSGGHDVAPEREKGELIVETALFHPIDRYIGIKVAQGCEV